MLAAGARYLLGWTVGVSAARLGAVVSLAAFASLHAMYFVNVKILPFDDIQSPRSVALDAAVLTIALLLAAAAVRSRRLRRARDR